MLEEQLTMATQPQVTPQEKDEQVLVSKTMLNELFTRLDALEQNNRPTETIKSLQKKTVKVWTINDKVVVKYGKSYERTELGGRKFIALEVYLEGEEKPIEVDMLKFREEGIYLDAEVLEVSVKERVEEKGMVVAVKCDYDNYKSIATDKEVPLLVKYKDYLYVLKLPTGREITLPVNVLN